MDIYIVIIVILFIIYMIIKRKFFSNNSNSSNLVNYFNRDKHYQNKNIHQGPNFGGLDNLKDGFEFEKYIANLLIKLGYQNVKILPMSNDYGSDILAIDKGIKYAIQCKYYSSPVGISAVQEIIGGKNYYKAHVAIVVTNNIFTQNAINLAETNNVILWNRKILFKLINEAQYDYIGIQFLEKLSAQLYRWPKVLDDINRHFKSASPGNKEWISELTITLDTMTDIIKKSRNLKQSPLLEGVYNEYLKQVNEYEMAVIEISKDMDSFDEERIKKINRYFDKAEKHSAKVLSLVKEITYNINNPK